MNDLELLRRVRSVGISLWLEGSTVRYRAPRGVLTPDLLSSLKSRKEALRELLRAEGSGGAVPPITRAPRDGALPLSFAQQRLWFMDQLEPGQIFSSVPTALRLRGRVDVESLRRAFEEIERRHEVLRTTFDTVQGKPCQRIHPPSPFELPVVDISTAPDPEAEARRLCLEEVERCFELSRGPLWRARLLRLSGSDQVLVVNMHHIVSDGWSAAVLVREVAALYVAFDTGLPSPLPELPVQYADYTLWQRGWLDGELLERQLDYWREKLADLSPLELPTARPRPPVQSFTGASAETRLSKAVLDGLTALGRAENATLFMVLLGAFQVLLGRLSDQEDIAVGSPIAGRTHAELEGLIGFFINTLVLRTDLSGDPTFRELIARVQRDVLGAYAHQHVPFEKLVDELAPRRDPSRAPLVQVILVLQNVATPEVTLSGLSIRPEPISVPRITVDLWVSFTEDAHGLHVAVQYNTDIFDRATVERFLLHLTLLFEDVAMHPERRISELTLERAADVRRVLVDWNETEVPRPPHRNIHHLFEANAAEVPDARALVWSHGAMSYAELDRRANRLAHHLRGLGVASEARIGVFAERSPAVLLAVLAIWKAGGAYVPLDPAHPLERLRYMIQDSGVMLILAQEDLIDELPALDTYVVPLDVEASIASGESDDELLVPIPPQSTAYVIYTSGSTGQPKGVEIEHRGVVNLAEAQRRTFGVARGCRILQFARLAFDASIFDIVMAIASGAELHFASSEESRPGPELAALLRDREIDLVTLPPSALSVVPHGPLPALRTVIVAGEACPSELARRWSPGRSFFNAYGPTETTIWATVYEVEGAEAAPPIGRPVANVKAYVLDRHFGPVPMGVPGELYVAGAGLARGYLNRPALSAERFLPSPFSDEPGARMYRTGDRARWRPDGTLEFLGRRDHQVKVRGFRIEIGEIEAALGLHPAVRDAVVVVRDEGLLDRRLVAYVVPEADRPRAAALREHLHRTLPEYMVPQAFVLLDALPTLPSGKVDRGRLPAPDVTAEEERHVATPRTDAERALTSIFEQVLRVGEVGIHDNFFELGGDSILSIQVVARANDAGLALSPRQFFAHPTVAALAAIAGERGATAASQPELVEGDMALLPVHRFFLDAGLHDPDHFTWTLVLEAERGVEIDLLEQALRMLPPHHDALRLRFSEQAGGWRGVHEDTDSSITFARVDLSGLSEHEQERELEARTSESERGLSLARGPILRVTWLTRGEGRPGLLLLVLHHFVVDAISWRVLIEDVCRIYEQLARGEGARLPPKTTSFREWARRLEVHARSDELLREMEHWAGRSTGETPRLPRDFAASDHENLVATIERVAVQLPQEDTKALLQRVPQAYRTQVNDVLLTALAQTLAGWTGGRRALVDLEGHGREDLFDDIDLSRTVGWFTTLFPVALEVDPKADLGQTLKSIKEQLRKIPGRGLGHGLLRYLGDEETRRTLAALPSPEVNFNYMGQLGEATPEISLLRPLRSAVPVRDERNRRAHLLDVGCGVQDGCLSVSLAFSRAIHARATIERVALDFVERLRSIIAHCLRDDAGGCTPSDFSLVDIDQAALDRLVGDGRNVEDVFGLSPMQQGMLFHSERDQGSGVYVQQFRCVIRGTRDGEEILQAFRALIEQQPMLRTSFHWEGLPEPAQVVHRRVQLPVERQDWRALPTAQWRAALSAQLEDDRRRGFDLTTAPVMRLLLARVEEDAHVFVWSHHHILLDGWSLPLLWKDLFTSLQAFERGERVPSERRRRFRDYIAWLRRQDLGRARAYWRERLQGVVPAPLGLLGPRSATSQRRTLRLQLPQHESEALSALARCHRLTLSTLAHGAWAILLSRYGGERDVVFGSTTSGRPAQLPGVETMVGLFINTLPVRVEVFPDEALLPWFQQLSADQVEMRQYEALPLWEVQKLCDISRSDGLFESILVFENYPVEEAIAEQQIELSLEEVEILEETSYPLAAAVAPGREISLRLTHDRSRLSDEMAEQILEHWAMLLRNMVGGLERPMRELPMVGEAERRRLLVEWNDTEAGRTVECIHERFAEQAERNPDAIAVMDGDLRITYRELDARANGLARRLVELGVGPEVPVGLCAERSIELVIGLLGIQKAGGASVPLDPRHPRERLRFMIADVGAPIVLAQRSLMQAVSSEKTSVLCLDEEIAACRERGEFLPSKGVNSSSLAYVLYTSGSTGRPKGVACNHEGVVNLLLDFQQRVPIGVGDACTFWTSPGFDVAFYEVFSALISGATLHIVPEPLRADAEAFIEWLGRTRITSAYVPPFMVTQMLAAIEAGRGPVSLRRLLVGVEPIPEPLLVRMAEALPQLRILNGYGPTEATICATLHPVGRRGARPRATPIGRPVRNAKIYILDRHQELLPVGAPGELCIGGVGLARGYVQRAGVTAERFIPDPFASKPGERMYRTGDVARWLPDGSIEFIGRVDHQIKLRGHRIELGEIESVLARHSGVSEAVVVAREDATEGKTLVAYAVPREGTNLGPAELRAHLRARLPEVMCPQMIVILDRLPLTVSGKIDRRSLPAPSIAASAHEQMAVPCTPTEETLVQLFGEVLASSSVHAEADFFALGGHSLLATRLVSRIRVVFAVDLPLHAIFDSPTVRGLAARVDALQEGAHGVGRPPLVRLARGREASLSFAQERLWFIDQLSPGDVSYNISAVFRLSGPLDIDALSRSFEEILRRHEVLRTSIVTVDGRGHAQLRPVERFEIAVTDLSHMLDHERNEEVRRACEAEARRPFALASEPLMRVSLFRQGSLTHVLMMTMHHVITDGWSSEILMREVTVLYAAFTRGEPSPLPELPVQYADYADWQRRWLSGPILDRELEYWRRTLDSVAPLRLPTAQPRPERQSHRGAQVPLQVPAHVAVELRRLAQSEGATLFMVLLAAYEVVLYRYCGQEDIAVGTPIAGRDQLELEPLIGFFVNTLVLRTDLSGDPTFVELLTRVRSTVLGAYEHQHVPFEKVVEALAPARDLGRTPLFQVMFTLQNAQLEELRTGDLVLDPVAVDNGTVRFELVLSVGEQHDNSLRGSVRYAADLFDASLVERMVQHLCLLVERIGANPRRRLSELASLTPEEEQRVLVEWSPEISEHPQCACVHELFEAQVDRTPNAVAVVDADGELTYRELEHRANRLVGVLRGMGVVVESRVGICLDRGIDLVVALLSIVKAGAAYVPLDPLQPRERLAYMISDSGIAVILASRATAARLGGTKARTVCLEDLAEQCDAQPRARVALGVHLDNLLYVLYTSGSTGRPKAVMVSHRNAARLLDALDETVHADAIGPRSIALNASLSFDASVKQWLRLLRGDRLCVIPEETRHVPERLLPLLSRWAVDVLDCTPSQLAPLLEHGLLEGERAHPSVLLVGGEAIDEVTWQQLAGDTRHSAFNVYGPTECTVDTTSCAITAGKHGSIGRPLPGTRTYVLDDHLQLTPIGARGELYIGGELVSRGYWNRPALTAERFLPDPFSESSGARMYRSGDIVRWSDDGTLEFIGRTDHQVKLRGVRIELGEIEAVLSENPGVSQAVVVVRRDGRDEPQLVGYVVPRDLQKLDPEELRDHLARHLPHFMVPSIFVEIASVPLSVSGKVDRKRLPVPTEDDMAVCRGMVPPRDQLEQELVLLWEELLGRNSIGIRDDFFALGGHSLLAVRLSAEVERRLGRRLPLVELFGNPTIERLATVLRADPGARPSSPVITLRAGDRPPIFCVHGMGGSAQVFRELSSALGDQPFHAFHALSDLDTFNHGDVVAMATRYVDALQRIRANEEYWLMGWSFGGLVAYEMARQLHDSRACPSGLILLDTWLPGPGRNGTLDQLALCSFLAREFGLSLSPEDLDELAEQSDEERLESLSRRCEEAAILPVEPAMVHLRRASGLYAAHWEAASRYRPKALGGIRVVLVRPEELPSESIWRWFEQDPTGGWGALVERPVEVMRAPGNHFSMIRAPLVERLAELLRGCLHDPRQDIGAQNDDDH